MLKSTYPAHNDPYRVAVISSHCTEKGLWRTEISVQRLFDGGVHTINLESEEWVPPSVVLAHAAECAKLSEG